MEMEGDIFTKFLILPSHIHSLTGLIHTVFTSTHSQIPSVLAEITYVSHR